MTAVCMHLQNHSTPLHLNLDSQPSRPPSFPSSSLSQHLITGNPCGLYWRGSNHSSHLSRHYPGSTTQQLPLPEGKREEILHSEYKVLVWVSHGHQTGTASLIGKLDIFLIPARHLFLCWLIGLSITDKKLHHHIKITADAREDTGWWEVVQVMNGFDIMWDRHNSGLGKLVK